MEMIASDIVHFLHLLGIESAISDAQRGWVRCSCPLAYWLHEGGKDRNPSFGIKIPEKDGEVPYYTCFTCNSSGNLPKLLHNLQFLSKTTYPDASRFLSQFELFESDEVAVSKRRIFLSDKFLSISTGESRIKENLPVPQSILDKYPLLSEKSDLVAHAEALKWLAYDRHISLKAIKQFKLRLFVNDLDDIGVVFPIISNDGVTVLDLWARLIDRKNFFRVTSSLSSSNVDYKSPNLLFGNHLFDATRSVVLVEGAIDALRLHTLGVSNVLASFGGLSNDQISTLYAPVIYLGFDSDEAGVSFSKKAVEKLNVPSIAILDWGVVGIKDAGELESLAQFKAVFDQRTKILKDKMGKIRKTDYKKSCKKIFLKDDGSFL